MFFNPAMTWAVPSQKVPSQKRLARKRKMAGDGYDKESTLLVEMRRLQSKNDIKQSKEQKEKIKAAQRGKELWHITKLGDRASS